MSHFYSLLKLARPEPLVSTLRLLCLLCARTNSKVKCVMIYKQHDESKKPHSLIAQLILLLVGFRTDLGDKD